MSKWGPLFTENECSLLGVWMVGPVLYLCHLFSTRTFIYKLYIYRKLTNIRSFWYQEQVIWPTFRGLNTYFFHTVRTCPPSAFVQNEMLKISKLSYYFITFLFLYESTPIFFENVTSMYTHFKTLKSIPIGTEIYVPKHFFHFFYRVFLPVSVKNS